MKTNVRISQLCRANDKATTQEKIDMLLAVLFIVSLAIKAYYSPYHY